MTRQHKLIIGLDDITSIIVECARTGCGSRAVFSPDKTDSLPPTCPHGHAWEWGASTQAAMAASPSAWLELLRRMRAGAANGGFRILLELDDREARREGVAE